MTTDIKCESCSRSAPPPKDAQHQSLYEGSLVDGRWLCRRCREKEKVRNYER